MMAYMCFGGIRIRIMLFVIGLMCLVVVGTSTIEDAQRNLDRLQSESNSRISSPSVSFEMTRESNLNNINNLNKITASSTMGSASTMSSIESIIALMERNLGLISVTLGGSAGTIGSGTASSGWPSGVPYHQELIDMLK